MQRFAFPAFLTPDEIDSGFVVTFRDLPEAITQGETVEQCLSEASDCLAEAMAARIDENLEIPSPSPAQTQEYLVPVPLEIAWKAELHSTMHQCNFTVTDLANLLGIDKDKVRRLIDPHYPIDQSLMEKALICLRYDQLSVTS
jgi:antitoxin HicB